MKRVIKRTTAVLLAVIILSIPITVMQAAAASQGKASSDSALGKPAYEEVFVSESGSLADSSDGSYVGIPSKSYEPGQTFEGITVDDSNKMKDVDGEEIGTCSDQMTGKVSEEELAAPRALTHLRGTNDSAQQSIEINDFRAVLRSGAVRNADGDYVWTAPNSNRDHAFTYRIIYSFSGEGEYDAQQIKITIPKTILRDRSGEYADVFDVAVPEENEGGLTDQNLFVYRVEGDNIVIYNRIGCVAAQNGFIEVSYKTSKSTFDYADYKSTTSANPKAGSDPFQASIEINRGDEHLSGESASVPVYIDTTAKLNSLNKNAPDSAYSSWSAAWGDAVKPANPGDYEYLVWTVRTEASCTQPYNLIYEDTFNQDDAMLLGYSVNKSDFSSSLTRTNIRSNYETAYVLTAHKKSAYNALLDSEGRYKIDNAIKVTLVPFDEVDGSSMRNASASYVKEVPKFEYPSGHFYAEKYGYDISNKYVFSSDQIRDYSLIEFNGDSGATIGDLKYYVYVDGYSYPWTLPDGVDAATVASDPEEYYGQTPVTYRLSDNTFYLKEISDEEYSEKLTAADYELEYIQMYIYEEAATYNRDTMQFDKRTLSTYSPTDVIKIYAEAGGNGNYVHVADYKLSSRTYDYTAEADAIVDKAKTSGMNVYFKGNVTGYRLETTNAYWYTNLGAYPYAKLKHSETVNSYVQKAIGEDSVSKLCLKNQADSEILRQNSKILGFTREGVDYITGKVKNSKLEKNFVGSTNSKKKREYTVTWDTSVSENYSDNDGTHAIPQQSGVFYDLLPDGAAFKKDSLYVYASGAALEAWKYTVNVDENYKGSGRTLLTIRINESGNNYRFRYSTVHSWNSITDFGNNLLNTVAYETGNASIAKGKTTNDTDGITESELMKGLDPSAGDAKRFLYTQAAHTADIILAANLGLEKAVRSGDDTSYSGTAQVNCGGSYSYNVRFATDDASRAKKLIAFDSLENHTVVSGADSGRSSDWHGTLKSVDTHQLTAMGIAPKVYYSTVDKLNIEQHHELSETSVWTLSDSFTGDLSTVKAIAVDMRKATDGSDFVLPMDKAVQFTIHMTAPQSAENDSLLPKAYNNIYLNNILIDVTNGNENDEKLIHQDYTEVLLKIAADLELLKVSRDNHAVVAPGIKFSLIGESDYGTSVDEILSTGENGRITRNNLEKGTYTLVEEDTTADFFKNDTRFTVIVDNKGKVTINGSEDTAPYIIEDPPRVHGRLDLMKKGKIDGETQTKQLYGAQFTIEGDSYYGNHIVLTEESKDGGIVSFPDIERGTYELTETRAANGYITTKEKYRVVCDRYGVVTLEHFENEAWAEVTDIENGYPVILNEPLHSLRLVKYDEVNNKLLGGAEFRLTGTSAYGTYVDITKGTDASGSYEGTVLFDGLEPGNQYTLKETKAPDHYQLDDTLRTVTISPEGEVTVTGLTKMPPDWQGGYYADCFGVPNTRAYEGEITITKRWLDADGRRITDSSDLPIPVVHVDTSEPKIDLPPQDAYLDKSKFSSALSGATTFKKTQESYTISTLPAGKVRVDDQKTRASIYVWKDGTDAYWWTDAATAHLPNDSSRLFYSLNRFTDIDLSGFDTSNVTNMSYMFYWCASLTTLDLGDKFDTGNVTDMRSMFDWCGSLTSLDLGDKFDTGKVINMSDMFSKCYELTSLNLGDQFDTGNVTNMSGMFFNCLELTSLDLGDHFDTGNVTDMNDMFCGCKLLTSEGLVLGDHFDTGNVTDMYQMFYNCSSLTTLDLGDHFDTGNVTNMSGMFRDCSSLTSLDLSSFDTGKVTSMYRMFRDCSSLTSLDLSGWDTGNVTNMGAMFTFCENLTTLDLSGWDTGNVTNMNSLFEYCYNLTTLDLSGWETGSRSIISWMFAFCRKLETVYVDNLWSTEKVYSSNNMFYGCSSSLVGGAGTHWNYSNPDDKTYARIDDPSNNEPGYFTYKAYVPPNRNKDDEPVGATLNNVLGGLINKLVSAVFGDSSAENSQAAPEIKTVKKPEMLSAGTPIVPAVLQLKSDGALGAGDGTDTNTVTFSQTTNSVLTHDSDDAEGKWLDNRDGTWTYRMKVFDADAKYYVWEEPIPGFSCDLDNDTGYTVINYPSQKNAIITNTRTTTNTCSLTLKKVLTGNASDYPEYDLAGMDYHFNVKLRGEGVAGEKVFGYTKFNNGEATVTLKAGEQMTFTNIPRNVTYTVTEQEENYKGAIVTTYSPSGTLTENNSDVTFTVTNAIKDKKSLNIKKTVLPYDGGELDDEDRARVFTFNVDLHADINGLYGELIFAGGKATAYLKHGETVSITGLPDTVGSYTVTEAESALYNCDQPTQSGELIGKETSIEFKNTKIPEKDRETGSFTLKKLINGKTTTDNEFAFNIAMSKLDKNAVYTLSDGTSFTSDINGSANLTIQLAHDESVKFSDLPVGAEYTVSEQACNYTASYAITGTERVVPLTAENTETDKQLTTSKITVQKDDDITITYTNTDKRYDVFIAKVIEAEKGYELLEGAELQIIEKDNESNVIETWTTTDEQHKSEVPQGTYILREVTAPFGYMKAPDIVFTVDDQGHVFLEGSTDETAELKMVDKPVELAVTGAGGVIPVAVSASISFVILLAAVVIKNRKNNIKEKRSTTK